MWSEPPQPFGPTGGCGGSGSESEHPPCRRSIRPTPSTPGDSGVKERGEDGSGGAYGPRATLECKEGQGRAVGVPTCLIHSPRVYIPPGSSPKVCDAPMDIDFDEHAASTQIVIRAAALIVGMLQMPQDMRIMSLCAGATAHAAMILSIDGVGGGGGEVGCAFTASQSHRHKGRYTFPPLQ